MPYWCYVVTNRPTTVEKVHHKRRTVATFFVSILICDKCIGVSVRVRVRVRVRLVRLRVRAKVRVRIKVRVRVRVEVRARARARVGGLAHQKMSSNLAHLPQVR